MKIKPVTDARGHVAWFEDKDSGREYRRIVGGVAWPYGQIPGALVVLGEEREALPGDKQVHEVRVLAAVEESALQDLAPRAAKLRDGVHAHLWVLDLSGPHVAHWDAYDRELQAIRKPRLRTTTLPGVIKREADRFRFYDSLLNERTATAKTIHFGADSPVVRQYGMVTDQHIQAGNMDEWPLVAACLFALAEIDLNQPRTGARGTQRRGVYA